MCQKPSVPELPLLRIVSWRPVNRSPAALSTQRAQDPPTGNGELSRLRRTQPLAYKWLVGGFPSGSCPELGRQHSVGQICSLPYRRILIGKASGVPKPVQIRPRPAGGKPRDTNRLEICVTLPAGSLPPIPTSAHRPLAPRLSDSRNRLRANNCRRLRLQGPVGADAVEPLVVGIVKARAAYARTGKGSAVRPRRT